LNLLGLSCFYHDAAACLYRDGVVVAAAEEERFSRRKHDASFPSAAARYCLEEGGIEPAQLDYVVFYEKPLLKFSRILTATIDTFPRGLTQFAAAMPVWLREKLWIPAIIRERLGYRGELLYCEHHLSHAASAFLLSPFEEAAVLTVDGIGEWASTALGVGHGTRVELVKELHFPHSLGLLYSAFTAWLGFEINEGEYKVMGMAAYGQPRYVDQVRALIRQAEDGSFGLDMRYFGYHHGLKAWSGAFESIFGPPRRFDAALEEQYADVAASIQRVTEEAMVGLAQAAHRLTGGDALCLAGGVGLNVLANRAILRETSFRRLFVPPGAGDSGGAVGAAAYVYHTVLGHPRTGVLENAYLGPGYSDDEVRSFLDEHAIPYRLCSEEELVGAVAAAIARNEIVGWFQGRMEFGPRALGARSILGNPCEPSMKQVLNEKIKHREAFRPFAPSVAAEDARRFFEDVGDSPFMLMVADVHAEARDLVPAITHVDGTARLQTVTARQNPRYYALLRAVERRTGVPMVINTSFNVRGEPIVRTPADAFRCFSHTDMDLLALGSCLVSADAKRADAPYPGRRRVQEVEAVWVA
jgi:carbamoyltransferase